MRELTSSEMASVRGGTCEAWGPYIPIGPCISGQQYWIAQCLQGGDDQIESYSPCKG